MYDSERDSFMIALKALGYSMNTTNESEIEEAYQWLIDQRDTMDPIYAGDDVIDNMISGNKALAVVYSGDASYIISENPNLDYFTPEQGTNRWYDAMVITKDCSEVQLAHEFIDFMIDHHLMDLKNKPGKASTGYMTALDEYKAPYVFSCFNQTIFDAQVLTHELGHAFAGYQAMRHQPISNYYSESTDIAEIHSMSMEQFSYPYAEWFFGEQADKFRFAHLQDAITFVPFGVAVDEFQHICYAHPELTPKERTYEWHKLEEKYMPWRTYDNDEFMERGGYWYHKLHIYLYPFYYINYTLTTMGAMEFAGKNREDHEAAWADYKKLCSCGGSMSYKETLRYANLAVPFEEGSVAKAVAQAKETLLSQM